MILINKIKKFPKRRQNLYYGYIIVAAAFTIHLISFSLSDSYGAFLNPWVNDFGWTRVAISGAYSVSFLVMGLLGVVMGIVTDRYSPRIALTICSLFLGGGFLLMARMKSEWHLYLAYGVIFGIGMSGIWAPLLSVISRWFREKRGIITGIVISGGGIGAFAGPPLVSSLITRYSWSNAAVMLGIGVLTTVLIAAQFLRRDPGTQRQRVPSPDERLQKQNQGVRDYSLKEAVRSRQFWAIFAVFFFLAYYTFSILVHLMPHAISLDISTTKAAYILSCISGASIAGNFVMGRVTDRIGPKRVLIISLLLMTAALFGLVFAGEVWMLFLFSIVFGFNHGGNATAQGPIIAKMFGLKAHGAIFAIAALGFTFGGALGPLMSGYIFDLTGSYSLAFTICGLAGIAGLTLLAVPRPIKTAELEI